MTEASARDIFDMDDSFEPSEGIDPEAETASSEDLGTRSKISGLAERLRALEAFSAA